MKGKVYFFGRRDAKQIKIGFTIDSLTDRKKQLLRGQLEKVDLVLLAAVNGTSTHESFLKKYFADLKDVANSTETFEGERLELYLNWLRQQWWVYINEDDIVDETPTWPEWMPSEERYVPFPEENPTELIPRFVTYSGPLAGTPWNRLSTPTPKIGEDFYTPKEIVDAARQAMGGIDLDPASHWQANRIHKIPRYYHLQRCAFHNPWFGRVWLNPPYGNNAPWFSKIIEHWDNKEITQICMISPVWAFTTQQAKPIIDRSSAMILLAPTPSFWGNPNGKTGTNHPHAIIYLGQRVKEFHFAFRNYGIPCRLFPNSETVEAAA